MSDSDVAKMDELMSQPEHRPLWYTGIGSRKTPEPILEQFREIGYELACFDVTLRSGGADGADSAFEAGCDRAEGSKDIFLPWPGFNGNEARFSPLPPEAYEISARFHPYWLGMKRSVQSLHARNVQQILGTKLDHPSLFVVCYTNPNRGGTTQALRIAHSRKIKVYNFWNERSYTVEEILSPFSDLLKGD